MVQHRLRGEADEMGQVRASNLSAEILALLLWCAPFMPAHAGCTIDDFGDAFSSAVDSMQDLLNSPACLPVAGSPGFWIVAGSFTAATASSNQIRGFCDDLQKFNKDSLDAQQQAKDLFARLPGGVQGALANVFGDLTDAAKDLNPVVAYASCACQVANSTGVAKVLDVGGACFKDALCWFDEVLFDNSCESAQYVFQMLDCTKGVEVSDYTCDRNGFCHFGPAAGCFCPKPMSFGITWSIESPPPENCRTPGSQGYCVICSCPNPSKSPADNALGVCICPDGTPLQANGVCAPPCPGSCPPDQIVKSAFLQANGVCVSQCSCPTGQSKQDGVCQFPACAVGETRIPSGACCAKTQVSACGECCGPRQIPDEVSGTCVANFRQKMPPNMTPRPATTPSRVLFSPSAR
jgi:hypothetical protein